MRTITIVTPNGTASVANTHEAFEFLAMTGYTNNPRYYHAIGYAFSGVVTKPGQVLAIGDVHIYLNR